MRVHRFSLPQKQQNLFEDCFFAMIIIRVIFVVVVSNGPRKKWRRLQFQRWWWWRYASTDDDITLHVRSPSYHHTRKWKLILLSAEKWKHWKLWRKKKTLFSFIVFIFFLCEEKDGRRYDTQPKKKRWARRDGRQVARQGVASFTTVLLSHFTLPFPPFAS